MEIVSIFAESKEANLFAVCYKEDIIEGELVDVFEKLWNQWNDPEYLFKFFTKRQKELAEFYGLSVDEAIQQVYDEVDYLENELRSIETKEPGYENRSLSEVFKPFHKSITSLNFREENFRKGRLWNKKALLRFYALELNDETLIITGGGIKLSEAIQGDEMLMKERENLNKVKYFLKFEGIESKEGLI